MSDDPSHLDDTSGWSESGAGPDPEEGSHPDGLDEPEEALPERPMFAHPEWTVGMVLIFAVVFLLLGVLGHPLWLLIGSPFILVLVVWIGVRWTERRRRRASAEPDGA